VSVQATFSATLVDEWVRLGVTDAVICPGSRSTPLALALAARLTAHVRLDERSAAFYALGLAMATGRPTIVCVTSGTAAAELHPAVVEAHHARVPLIVCTADRPPELHHTGAPQTIEQVGLYAAATRWAASPGVPVSSQESTWRPLAVRAFTEAVHGAVGPGPVHLNLEFREPLTGGPGPLPRAPGPVVTRAGEREIAGAAGPLSPAALSGRGMLVVGATSPQRLDPARILVLGDRLGWPVLADPLSGCRVTGTIGAADAIVRSGPPLPEWVVLLGTPWLSRALGRYVSDAAHDGARVVVVDPFGQWADPLRVATEFHHGSVDAWLGRALEGASRASASDPAWLAGWRAREVSAQRAIARTVNEIGPSEPGVARTVYRQAASEGATIVVSASMPIRDLEWFAEPEAHAPRVLANRGANGIDGVVSTALGVSAAVGTSEGGRRRVIALLGDLAFLHDVSGLVNLPAVPCTFVVVDNGGGGIFSFLPQADLVEEATFEAVFGTPPASDLVSVARGFGLPVREVGTLPELEAALADTARAGTSGPGVVRVRMPERAQNVKLHDQINDAVRRALA
jgi:2-succinyl-5-enolpyruvyl-6-hydroxy-3-cyclohexene-1-carboxylate synthase